MRPVAGGSEAAVDSLECMASTEWHAIYYLVIIVTQAMIVSAHPCSSARVPSARLYWRRFMLTFDWRHRAVLVV